MGAAPEMDITLRSPVNLIEGVIELKIGDKGYSGADLRKTISQQLIAKYLAPTGRRAGCLLITRSTRTTWKHPDTGAPLDFSGLLEMLRQKASTLQKNFPDEIHIAVFGLDLKPRLAREREVKVPTPTSTRTKPPKRQRAQAARKSTKTRNAV